MADETVATPASTERPNVAPDPTTDTSYASQTVQPNAVQAAAQAQPQVQPQVQPQGPPQSVTTPGRVVSVQDPTQQHTGWFHGMMQRMNQGDSVPVRDRNGNPVMGPDGRPQMQPLTSKQMGRSILAGVLSAMAATEQHQPYRNGNGIWVNPSNEAVGAARQAFQAGRPQAQQAKANEQLQAQRTQQYATYKANVDMFKMAHEMSDMKFKDRQTAVAGFAPAYEAAMRGEIEGFDPAQGDFSEDEARKQMATLDPTTHMMVPNGKVVQHLDASGNPTGESDVHWMILPGQNGKITLTKAMIKAAGLPETTKEGAQVPLTQWSDLTRRASSAHIIGSLVDQVAATLDIKDKAGKPVTLDVPKFVKAAQMTPDQTSEFQGLDRNDPVKFQTGLEKINQETQGRLHQALSDQGINIDSKTWADQQKADLKKQEAEELAKITAEKVKIEKEAAANTPAGQADLKNKQLEIKLKEQQLNQNMAASQGLDVPKGFVPNPDPMALSANDIQSDLQKKGVKVPDNFAALYAIAHNDAALTTYSASPRKGVPVMPQATALAFIRQYLNPGYQEADYAAGANLKKEIASTRTGTAGGSLLAAGTAVNHLDLLMQAADRLNNNDIVALNKLANNLGIQVGKSPAVTFKGISEFVNEEVGKVTAGGQPREAELKAYRDTLNSDQSPQQTRDVVKSYIGLMAGRVNEINTRNQQYFGRDVKGVSPAVARVFTKYGFETPGYVSANVNGHVGSIPKDQVAAFKRKYPNAVIGGQ